MATSLSTKEKLAICRTLYEEGAFDPEIARELGITIERFRKMYDEQPAFTEFVDMGRTLAMAYWYSMARLGLKSKGFNTSVWMFTMKNQYGWADKVETVAKDMDNMNLDDLRTKLSTQMSKIQENFPELFTGTGVPK